jgi:hypothetical protein
MCQTIVVKNPIAEHLGNAPAYPTTMMVPPLLSPGSTARDPMIHVRLALTGTAQATP